jgi:serine/threonine protein kinase
MDKYSIGDLLGTGGSGAAVSKAIRKADGVTVAVKQFPRAAHDATAKAKAEAEFEILKKLTHPGILPCFDFFTHKGSICLVTPLVEPGSEPFLNAEGGSTLLSPVAVANVGYQLALALEYLHAQKLLHRDLKPGNLLLSADRALMSEKSLDDPSTLAKLAETGKILLGDFGISGSVGTCTIRMTGIGTQPYCPPEVLRDEGEEQTTAVDIWSMGATLMALATGHLLANSPEAIVRLKRGDWTLDQTLTQMSELAKKAWQGLGEPLQSVIKACVQPDHTRRPKASDIVLSPAFDGARETQNTLKQQEGFARLCDSIAAGIPCTFPELLSVVQAASSGNPSARSEGTLSGTFRLIAPAMAGTSGQNRVDAFKELMSATQTLERAFLSMPRARSGLVCAIQELASSPFSSELIGGLELKELAGAFGAFARLSALSPPGAASDTRPAQSVGEEIEDSPSATTFGQKQLSADEANTMIEKNLTGLSCDEVPILFAATCSPSNPFGVFAATCLNLRGRRLASHQAVPVIELLPLFCRMERLDFENFCNNPYSPYGYYSSGTGSDGVLQLAKVLPSLTQLRELQLGGNSIGDNVGASLVRALRELNRLEHIGLSGNSLGNDTALALSMLLPTLPRLKYLDLSSNAFQGEPSLKLAAALSGLSELSFLSLSNCDIVDELAIALAAALRGRCCLVTLMLDGNRITAKGAAELAHALFTHSELATFSLIGNAISEAALTTIATSLPSGFTRKGLRFDKAVPETERLS